MAIFRVQRLYAFRDYLNLTEEGAKALKAERTKIAQQLRANRASIQKFDHPDAVRKNLDFRMNEATEQATKARNEIFNKTENQSTLLNSNGDTNSMTHSISDKHITNHVAEPKKPVTTQQPSASVPQQSKSDLSQTTGTEPTTTQQKPNNNSGSGSNQQNSTTSTSGDTSTPSSGGNNSPTQQPNQEGSWWSRQNNWTKGSIIGGAGVVGAGGLAYGVSSSGNNNKK